MLLGKFLTNQILRQRLLIKRTQVQQCDAKLLGCKLSYDAPLDQPVLNDIGNEGRFAAKRLCLSLLRRSLV